MLVKMGWSEGKGLGRNEDGMSSHIRVKRKVESVGIGFEEDGQGNVAFVQQIQSFEQILADLNASPAPKVPKGKVTKKRKRKPESREAPGEKSKSAKKARTKVKSKSSNGKGKKGEKGDVVRVRVSAAGRKHAKVLKAKNVAGYSAADLKAILGGSG